jgi:hypothetical protein
MTRDLSPYASLLLGAIIIGGIRYWLARARHLARRATTPRVEYIRTPPPVYDRDLCLGCRRLVRSDLMGWDGSRYICDDCAWLDAA